jgi:glycosyltransferase involved in cell wall biosynthesis
VEKLLYFLQQLDREDEFIVLIPSKDRGYWKPTAGNFRVVFCDYKNYSIGEQLGMKKMLDKLAPDLVHFCMPQQPIFYKKSPVVTTIHDLTLLKTYMVDKNWLVYHFKQLVGRVVFRRVAKKSEYIITPSRYTKDELLRFYHNLHKSKINVIYDSAEVVFHKPKKVAVPYSAYILYVGQQSGYKNIRRLGEAHQKLLDKYPDLGLVLVGSINEAAKINQEYFKRKRYRNIYYTGRVSDEELAYLYQNAQAYVFPSLMEGFGLPGLEAMEFGAPVVSSNATCLPEVYGKAAEYFSPLDVQDMATKIDKVLSDEGLRKKLVDLGHKQVKKYSWERTARETLAIYRKGY